MTKSYGRRLFHAIVCTGFLMPSMASAAKKDLEITIASQMPNWNGEQAVFTGTQGKNKITLNCGMKRGPDGKLAREPAWDSLTRSVEDVSITTARTPDGTLLMVMKRGTYGALGALFPNGTIKGVSGYMLPSAQGLHGFQLEKGAAPSPLFADKDFKPAAQTMTELCAANVPANWDPGSLADEAERQSKYVSHLNNLIATASGKPPVKWQTPATTAPATTYKAPAPAPAQTKVATVSPPAATGATRKPVPAQSTTPAKKTTNEFVYTGDTVIVPPEATRTSSPNGNSSPYRTNTGGTSPYGSTGSGHVPGEMRAGDFLPPSYHEAKKKQEEVRKIPQVQYYEFEGLK